MKLGMLAIVQRTVAALRVVENAIAATELGYVHVSVAGLLQDDELAAAAKPAILAALCARRAALLKDLDSYGVVVEGAECGPVA